MKRVSHLFVVLLGLISMLSVSCEKEKIEITENRDLLFPDGLTGEAIFFNQDTIYQVPTGFALYVISGESIVDGKDRMRYYITSNWMSEIMKNKVIIIPPDSAIHSRGLLNGLLVKNNVEIVNWYSDTEFTVPAGRNLYLTSFKASGMSIDSNDLDPWEDNSLEVFSPLILPEGSTLRHEENFVFTGYFRDN